MSSDLVCPICCDTLGERGGPTTLPCGHNGCLECMKTVQAHRSFCPLCRRPFDTQLLLSVNTQLRDLIAHTLNQHNGPSITTSGWNAFPSVQETMRLYSAELVNRVRDDDFNVQPSAPPLVLDEVDVMSIDPPKWMPDSASDICLGCELRFQPLGRLRHHCRLCGRLYCGTCSSQRLRLPPKFMEKYTSSRARSVAIVFDCRDPQRVCNMCAALLLPLQKRLCPERSRADCSPINDKFDWCSLRSWLNNPISKTMESDIYKATNILRSFHNVLSPLQSQSNDKCVSVDDWSFS